MEAGLEGIFPADYQPHSSQHSGKMQCLKVLLSSILGPANPDQSTVMSSGTSIAETTASASNSTRADDKVVVVSNSTAALDLIQKLCDTDSYKTVRIHASTDVLKRQDTVNSFDMFGSAQVGG